MHAVCAQTMLKGAGLRANSESVRATNVTLLELWALLAFLVALLLPYDTPGGRHVGEPRTPRDHVLEVGWCQVSDGLQAAKETVQIRPGVVYISGSCRYLEHVLMDS